MRKVSIKHGGGYDPKKGPKHPDNQDPTLETGTLYVNGSNLGPAERNLAAGTVEAGPHVAKRAAKSGSVAIVRIDRSPMNAKRWQLSLACGHDLWVTATRRPTKKTSKCATCAREVA